MRGCFGERLTVRIYSSRLFDGIISASSVAVMRCDCSSRNHHRDLSVNERLTPYTERPFAKQR